MSYQAIYIELQGKTLYVLPGQTPGVLPLPVVRARVLMVRISWCGILSAPIPHTRIRISDPTFRKSSWCGIMVRLSGPLQSTLDA